MLIKKVNHDTLDYFFTTNSRMLFSISALFISPIILKAKHSKFVKFTPQDV